MKPSEILSYFQAESGVGKIIEALEADRPGHIIIDGALGSSRAMIAKSVMDGIKGSHVFILNDKEAAAYFYNDLESFFEEKGMDFARKKMLFFPTTFKKPHDYTGTDKSNVLARTEALNRILSQSKRKFIVTYPEAIAEKIITRHNLSRYNIKLNTGDEADLDTIVDMLHDNGFELQDFVVQPGQFAVRGGIVDVFSYSNDYPYRIEFFGDEIESIRTFDPVTQVC